MSAKITGQVWDLLLSPAKQTVLLALADHADHNGGSVHPGVPLIAWKTGYSERQVQRIMKDLEGDGILVKVGTPANQPTIYRIDLSKGQAKPAFKPRSKKIIAISPDASTNDYTHGDKMSPQQEGDKMSPVTSQGKDESVRGDIASANLSSIRHKEEPSLKEKREGGRDELPSTPLSPSMANAIDAAAARAVQPNDTHTGAMMQADVFIRVYEAACKAWNAPQHIPRTLDNKRVAAQWYVDGYAADEIRTVINDLFDAGKPVVFKYLGEKLSAHRITKGRSRAVIDDGSVPDEQGVDTWVRKPAQQVSAA